MCRRQGKCSASLKHESEAERPQGQRERRKAIFTSRSDSQQCHLLQRDCMDSERLLGVQGCGDRGGMYGLLLQILVGPIEKVRTNTLKSQRSVYLYVCVHTLMHMTV